MYRIAATFGTPAGEVGRVDCMHNMVNPITLPAPYSGFAPVPCPTVSLAPCLRPRSARHVQTPERSGPTIRLIKGPPARNAPLAGMRSMPALPLAGTRAGTDWLSSYQSSRCLYTDLSPALLRCRRRQPPPPKKNPGPAVGHTS